MTDKDVICKLLEENGISKKEFAKILGLNYNGFVRGLNKNKSHPYTMKQFAHILNLLGYQVVLAPKGTAKESDYILNFEENLGKNYDG